MSIKFKVNEPISTDQFIDLLNSSTLGERRPIDDRECIDGMLSNSNITVSAWEGSILVGIARSVTDYNYACYLSDLAVNKQYQKLGLGKKLQILTQEQLGPKCSIVLTAAPAANSYYEKIGYSRYVDCWVLERDDQITS